MDLHRYWFKILLENFSQAKIFHKKSFHKIQVAPWVFANPRPHDEEYAGPDQGELDEEGVEVGGRLGDDVPHQVNSTTGEVVKFFHRSHLEHVQRI